METTLFLGCAFTASFFYYFCYKFIFNKSEGKITRIKSISEEKDHDNLPEITLKDIVWTWFFGEGRMAKFLLRIAQRSPLNELKFWGSSHVFVNDFQLASVLFKDPAFHYRPPNALLSRYGILGSSGETWKSHSKFCKRHLKEFGFGTKSMEHTVHEQVDALIEKWRNFGGARFSPNHEFYVPVLNTIWKIMTSETISLQDQEFFLRICSTLDGFKKQHKFPNFLISNIERTKLVNWILRLAPIRKIANPIADAAKELVSYLRQKINERKSRIDFTEIRENLIDTFLLEQKNTSNPDSIFHGIRGDKNLLTLMFDLFIAGGETTTAALVWSIVHLIQNLDVQSKIRDEIDNIVGNNRRPAVADRINCPYTEAFIWEVLRVSPSAVATHPHYCNRDTNVGPFFIKANTVVTHNIYGIHHDPKIWNDPQNFRPERFLNVSSDKTTLIKNEALCAFSVGLRRCIGEHVARDTMFLFISTICQKFNLKPDPFLMGKYPIVSDSKSLAHSPQLFYVTATERTIE